MSYHYQLSIRIKNGTAVIEESLATPPPDGRFVIMGEAPSDGSTAEHVTIERRGVNDAIIVQANGNHF